jgi:hypothetical protein
MAFFQSLVIVALLTVMSTNNAKYGIVVSPPTFKISPETLSGLTSCFLVTASKSGDSSASAVKSSLNGGSLPADSFLHRFPYRTDSIAPFVFLITPLHGPRRQTVHFVCYPIPRECVCATQQRVA